MAREIASNIKAYSGADFYATTAELSASRKLNSSTVTAFARKEKRLEHVAYLVIKRSFDFVTSLVGCVFLLPVIAFVKVGNILTGDFKPMFLKQERLGKDGKVFKLIKFRSMVMLDDGRQADALLDELFKKQVDVKDAVTRLRDLLTSPVLSEKYACSVRVNEARLLPDEINQISAFHRQKLKKVVVTLSLQEDYQVNDSNCYRIHRLEENLYKNFLPKDYTSEDVINKCFEDFKKHYKENSAVLTKAYDGIEELLYKIRGKQQFCILIFLWGKIKKRIIQK